MSRPGQLSASCERGISLLELLMALAMLGILLPVVAGWFTAITHTWQDTVERIEAREQALSIVRRIELEVREGERFTLLANGMYFLDGGGKWIRYSLSQNGLLLREAEGVGAMVIGAQIATCQFATTANGKQLRLRLVTKVGQASVEVDQTWTGRGGES